MHGSQKRDNHAILRDLQLAAEFQRAVLPEPVSVPYLSTSIRYQPHGEVSGDVYNFLLNREQETSVFLGDATGHGVAAALLTMMVLLGLDGIRRNLPVDESLRHLNRILVTRKTGLSVTAIFFRITPQGNLTVTHAGHPPLLLAPADGSPVVRFEKGGCPLGIFEDEPVPYEVEQHHLYPGDKLMAYTDAVIEWKGPHGEPFGLARLIDVIDNHRDKSIDEINDISLDELTRFSQGTPCHDDLTMLMFEFTG